MNDFAWVIEAPGQNYLATRAIGHNPEFFWTPDHTRAVRFISAAQADGVMMAVRRMEPALWAFALNLGEAQIVEHGWLVSSSESKLHDLTEEDMQRASIDWSIAEVDLGLSDTPWGCMEHVLKAFIRHRRAGGNPNPSPKDPTP